MNVHLKNVLYYALGHFYRQGIGLVSAFIRPALLSLEGFGLWSLIKIIPEYASYLHFGARSAMRYRLPTLRTRRAGSLATTTAETALAGSLLPNLAVALGLVLVAWFGELSDPWALVLMALLVILHWYYHHVVTLLKTDNQFAAVGGSTVVEATVLLALNLLLIPLFGVAGAVAAVLFSVAAALLLILRRRPLDGFRRFDAALFKEMVREGFPILLFNVASLLVVTFDRFLVSGFLGLEAMGQYGLSVMIMGFMMNIPGASREVVETRTMERLGEIPAEAHFLAFFVKPMVNSAFLMPLLVGPAYYLLPLFIPWLLPRYEAAVLPAQILAVGGWFLALSFAARGMIIAHGLQLVAVVPFLVSLLVNAGLGYLAIVQGFGLPGVALASLLSFAVAALGLLLLVLRRHPPLDGGLKERLWLVPLPLLTMGAALWLVDGRAIGPSAEGVVAAARALLFYGGCTLPPLWWLARRGLLALGGED